MRYRKAIITLFTAAAITALTACGGAEKPGETKAPVTAAETTTAAAPETPKGAIESWGIYEEIFIPEGMKLAAGGITNAEDENAVRVLKTDNPLNYFYFILSTEEQSQKDIAATIEANGKYNPEEVTFKTGDFEWKGVGFNALGSDVAQMYAAIGDKVINVRIAGFAYNSDDAAAILRSIKVKEVDDTAATTETPAGEEATEAAASEEAATETKSNQSVSDPACGKSTADATGYVTLEVLQETYKWKQSAGAGLTYEDFRDHFGCDGAVWKEVWKEDHHGYKWRTEDGKEFLHVSFSVKDDGSEIYSSCTYSDAVKPAKNTTAAETAAAGTGADEKSAKTADAASSGDEGKWVIYEYKANGQVVSRSMLEAAGMGDTYLWLKPGGKAELYLFNQSVDATWKPGVVTTYGTANYSYEIDGDKLYLDMQGVYYTMVREGGSAPSGNSRTEETKPAEMSGVSGTPEGVPAGSGIISEEKLQKGYVWMSKVAKDIYGTTYEGLAEYFGVDGAFDKEEYSERMKRNKRYYKWISADNDTHFVYVNFDEKDAAGAPGVYTISGFNSSGFSAPDAEAKYLDEVKAEASEADKAAAANMKTKELAVDVSSGVGSNKMTVTVSMQIPESGWAYDEKKNSLINNDNIKASGAGFIQFTVEKEIEKFDFYKDKFENYQEIGEREIGGVTFQGRTYKRIGYEWTEYIAQIEEGKAVSIGIVKADISEGTAGDRILNSIQFK